MKTDSDVVRAALDEYVQRHLQATLAPLGYSVR